jgi:hypothetical protein
MCKKNNERNDDTAIFISNSSRLKNNLDGLGVQVQNTTASEAVARGKGQLGSINCLTVCTYNSEAEAQV